MVQFQCMNVQVKNFSDATSHAGMRLFWDKWKSMDAPCAPTGLSRTLFTGKTTPEAFSFVGEL